MPRRGTIPNWGNDVLQHADFSGIQIQAQSIIGAVGEESVDVYAFLMQEFGRGSITNNTVFQFVYRAFYRLNNVGLSGAFLSKYFELMEAERRQNSVDIYSVAKILFE